MYSAPLTLGLDTHHATASGTEPVGAVAVARHALDDVVVAMDEIERVPFRVEHCDTLGMGKHHQSQLPVYRYVGDHLTHPLLCALPVAETHALLPTLQVNAP